MPDEQEGPRFQHSVRPLDGNIFQADEAREADVARELGEGHTRIGPLFFKRGATVPRSLWAQNQWLEPFEAKFDSIADAAALLRERGRSWSPLPFTLHRRCALIQEKLPFVYHKAREFPWFAPAQPLGAYTLVDEHTLIASARCTSPFPQGNIVFKEDRENPPSSAYLKLWEAFSRLGSLPAPGELWFDAGASPGGWTWVLREAGARVFAVDRSPLAPSLMKDPMVEFRGGNAFSLGPESQELAGLRGIVCDVACYPEKLWEWVAAWLDSGFEGTMICTIKMLGEGKDANLSDFASVRGAFVYHGSYNKHELTWMRPGTPGRA